MLPEVDGRVAMLLHHRFPNRSESRVEGKMTQEKNTAPAPLSKKQQERRARAEVKQRKRQERARKKRRERNRQRGQIHAALREIGAIWEKGGKAFLDGRRRYYVVSWHGEQYSFDRPGDILRWARKQAHAPHKLDYAEMEIARLIAQARQEMESGNEGIP